MKTVQGLLHQVVDLLTASLGYIDLDNPQEAVKQLKIAIGVVMEIGERLKTLLKDLEGSTQELRNPHNDKDN